MITAVQSTRTLFFFHLFLEKNVLVPIGVENAGVAFFKGVYERNDYFEKNKPTVIYDEQVRTNKAKDYQSQGRSDLGINSAVDHCANRTV